MKHNSARNRFAALLCILTALLFLFTSCSGCSQEKVKFESSVPTAAPADDTQQQPTTEPTTVPTPEPTPTSAPQPPITEYRVSNGYIDFEPVSGITNERDAMRLLSRLLPALGLEGTAEENFRYKFTDANSSQVFYTMKQQHDGADIYGASVSIPVNENGECSFIISSAVNTSFNEPTSVLTEEQALNAVTSIDAYGENTEAVYVESLYYPVGEAEYRIAYCFWVQAEAADGSGVQFEEVYIDAETGAVLNRTDMAIYDGDVERTSSTFTNSNGEALRYHVYLDDNNVEYLVDTYTAIRVIDAKKNKLTPVLCKTNNVNDKAEYYKDANYLFFTYFALFTQLDAANSNDAGYASMTRMLEAAEKAYDFYRAKGQTGFAASYKENQTNHGVQIIANTGNFSNNACSRSAYSWYLNAAIIEFSPEYVNSFRNDVMFHEYTHSIIASKNKLKSYDYMNGALNEAYADIMGDIIENDQSWVHGRRDGSKARSFGDSQWVNRNGEPNNDNDCNGVHTNCNVIYHCAYLMYNRFISDYGMTADQAMTEMGWLWYDSIYYLKEDKNTFSDCLEALYRAGKWRGYTADKLNMIEDCFDQVNVHHLLCSFQFKVVDENGSEVNDAEMLLTGKSEQNVNTHDRYYLTFGEYRLSVIKEGYDAECIAFKPLREINVIEIRLKPAVEEHSYRFYNVSVTWEEAKTLCEQFGGHLATIFDRAEMNAILEALALEPEAMNCYWIGLVKNNGEWRWIDGTPFLYTNWAENEPNNMESKEYCGHIFGQVWTGGTGTKHVGEWNDASNEGAGYAHDFYDLKNFGFICEYGSAPSGTMYIPDDVVVFEGHSYKVFTEPHFGTFAEAEQFCEALGGHLATITSLEENDFLYQYIGSLGIQSAYFGLTDESEEGSFVWSNGEDSSYRNWHSGEPNNESGNEDYAMFYYKFSDGTWNDGAFGTGHTSNDVKIFICEWDAEPAPESEPGDSDVWLGESRYRVIDKPMNWEEAKNYCESLGGHLVTITSEEEQLFITDLVNGAAKRSYWIGLSDTREWGNWEWVTGEALSYTNWAQNEPNHGLGGSERYIAIVSFDTEYDYPIYAGEWNDHKLDADLDEFGFICEWDG